MKYDAIDDLLNPICYNLLLEPVLAVDSNYTGHSTGITRRESTSSPYVSQCSDSRFLRCKYLSETTDGI